MYNTTKPILFFIGLFFLQLWVFAQENQGVVFDNYNPVNGQFINPSNIVDAKPWLDINIIGVGAFVYNNTFFYPNTTLLNFDSFKNEPNFNENVNNSNGFLNVLALGPSASLIVGRQSFSIYTTVRIIGNAFNIPSVLPKMVTTKGINPSDTGFYDIKNGRAKSMGWGEIGFTYGGIVKTRENRMITAAVSLKRLFGFQNLTVNVKDGLLHVVNPDSAALNSDNGKYSYADPASNAGRGWGISLGATFKKMKKNVDHYVPHSTISNCEIINYKYKIGVSLIDIGYINFRNESFRGNLEDITSIDTVNSASDILDEAKRLATDNRFTAPLPAALSIQADYNINDKFYLNASIIQRIPFRKAFGVERENLLTISGRYESKFFGVGVPVSIVNYQKVLLGFALRIANLTIGSDHFFPLFFKQDVNTASIYFNLKITLYKSPPCRHKKNKDKKEKYIINACPKWK